MRLNRSQIGRYSAILIAVLLMSIVPIQYFARMEQSSADSVMRNNTDALIGKIEASHTLTRTDYEKYITGITASGMLYDIQMKYGERRDYDNSGATSYGGYKIAKDYAYEMFYTKEILERLYGSEGALYFEPDSTFTITVTALKESQAQKVSHMLYQTDIADVSYTTGTLIY